MAGFLEGVDCCQTVHFPEPELGHDVEAMWLTGRQVPDHKTIADFRRDNGPAIHKTCAKFVALCHRIDVLKGDYVAIAGSKFKAVNNRDRTFTKGKIASRLAHLGADVEPYITEMVRVDRRFCPGTGHARRMPHPHKHPGASFHTGSAQS